MMTERRRHLGKRDRHSVDAEGHPRIDRLHDTLEGARRLTRIEVLFVDRVIEVVINSNDVGDIDLVRIVTPRNR